MPGSTAPNRCRTTVDGARTRWTSAFLLACFATLGLAADDLEQPLDADFLAYLAEMESEDDDWTIVAPVTAKQPPPAQPAKTDSAKQSPPPPKADDQEAKP